MKEFKLALQNGADLIDAVRAVGDVFTSLKVGFAAAERLVEAMAAADLALEQAGDDETSFNRKLDRVRDLAYNLTVDADHDDGKRAQVLNVSGNAVTLSTYGGVDVTYTVAGNDLEVLVQFNRDSTMASTMLLGALLTRLGNRYGLAKALSTAARELARFDPESKKKKGTK